MVSNCLVSDLASISHTVAVAPSLKKVIREEMFYFLFSHGKRCFTIWKEKVCQKWDSNPRLENQTAT